MLWKKRYHYHGIYDVLNQLTCNFSTLQNIKFCFWSIFMQVPLFTAEGLLRNHGRWSCSFCRLNIQAPAGFSLFKCIWACGTHECQRRKFDSTISFSCWWLRSSLVVKVTIPQLKRNTLHPCSVCTGYKSVCLSCYLLLVAVFFSMNLAWVVKLYGKCHQGWTAWTMKKKEKTEVRDWFSFW